MNKFSVFPEFVIFTKYLHELIKTEIILFQLYTKILQKKQKEKNKTKLLHVHQMYKDFTDHLV